MTDIDVAVTLLDRIQDLPETGRAIPDAATGETIGYAPEHTVADLDDAVARARAAQPAWEALGHEERTTLLLRTADLLGRVPADVYSGYVILRSPAAVRGDLVPVTPDSLPDPPASTALRNLFYGIEWWVFAAFAAYLWWQWSRDAVRADRRRRGTAAGADDGEPGDQRPADQPIASGA